MSNVFIFLSYEHYNEISNSKHWICELRVMILSNWHMHRTTSTTCFRIFLGGLPQQCNPPLNLDMSITVNKNLLYLPNCDNILTCQIHSHVINGSTLWSLLTVSLKNFITIIFYHYIMEHQETVSWKGIMLIIEETIQFIKVILGSLVINHQKAKLNQKWFYSK